MINLSPEIILQAYRAGIFPMAPDRNAGRINWYDPDTRGILPIAGLHVPKKLRRTIRKRPYDITFDRAFPAVMQGCADSRCNTWINDDLIELYTLIHQEGHAHSIEAWRGGKLAGGLYGIAIGGAFFGESMFSLSTDASKIALVYLAARLWRQGFELLDTQFINDHLRQFGVYEISRKEYHRRLQEALAKNVSFNKNQSSKLVEGEASLAGESPVEGPVSGVDSEENSCDFFDVAAFLHSITQTS